MTRRVVVREEAEADLKAAYGWYEQRKRGLGGDLIERYLERLQLIAERPELFADLGEGVRAVALLRFPYAVYYLTLEDAIEVIAVVHTSRDPDTWRLRV